MILVTGASGFVGGRVVSRLTTARGFENVAAYTSRPLRNVRSVVHGGYSHESVQFADLGLPSIRTLVHAGAWIPRSASEANDSVCAEANIRTTQRLLDGQLPDLERLILVSTVDVYGSSDLISELTPVAPQTRYGESKLACEHLASQWCEARGVELIVLRLGHVYGPGEEHFRKVIPGTMARIIAGEQVELVGAGTEERAFLYVDDAAHAIEASLDLRAGLDGPVNVASSQRTTIGALLDLIIETSGEDVSVRRSGGTAPGRSVVFDATRCRDLLLPTELPLREGIRIEWNHMRSIAR